MPVVLEPPVMQMPSQWSGMIPGLFHVLEFVGDLFFRVCFYVTSLL